MAKFVKSFGINVSADANGVFEVANSHMVIGSTDDASFNKIAAKTLTPTPENIAVLQAILNARFAELKAQEGIE